MRMIRDMIREIHRRSIWQVLGIYGLGSWAVYQVVLGVYEGVGLPDWVPTTAILLLLVGLPIVLATAFVQEGGPRRSRTDSSGKTESGGEPDPGDTRIDADEPAPSHTQATQSHLPASISTARNTASRGKLFTWNRAITAGVLAFAALGVAATGFMGLRKLGIGPAATLVSAGVLEEREPVLLAEFESISGDSVLASAVTEALRVDLETSTIVRLVQSAHVQDALRRMRRDPTARLTEPLALELAMREGIRAILVGDVTAAGGQYVLTARLISPDGSALASVRQTAVPDAVIEAADRLSAALRERLGESFKSIRSAEPLAQVTTPSLEALRSYSQALRAFATESSSQKAILLLQDAVTRDSTFAMAWRKLGIAYANVNRDSMLAAIENAYRYRDRLSDRERYLTEGSYFDIVASDTARAIVAYQTLLDQHPDDATALHNLARLHGMRSEFEKAAELYARAIEAAPHQAGSYRNQVSALAMLKRYDDLEVLLAAYEERFPEHYQGPELRGALAAHRFRYEEAVPLFTQAAEIDADGASRVTLRSILLIQGKHAQERRSYHDAVRDEPKDAIDSDDAMTAAITLAFHRSDPAAAADRYEQFATDARLRSMPSDERPYFPIVLFNVLAGRVDRAEQTLERWRRERPDDFEPLDEVAQNAVLEIAAAKGDHEGIIRVYRHQDDDGCLDCWFHLGRVFEDAGMPDSAIVAYETYLDPPRPPLFRVNEDRWWLPPTLKRLAALHESTDDAEAAARYYNWFIELWANADPELQPQVDAARAALAQLETERPSR